MFQHTFKFNLSAYFMPVTRKMTHTKGWEMETYRNKDKIHFWIRKEEEPGSGYNTLVDHGVVTKGEMMRKIMVDINDDCQLEVNDDIPVGYHTW